MARQSRSCSCGGANENCQRCFGRGWVEETSPAGGFGSAAGATSVNRTRSRAPNLPSFIIPAAAATSKVAQASRPRRRQNLGPRRSKRSKVPCFDCGTMVPLNRLEQHKAETCQKRTTADAGKPERPQNQAPFNAARFLGVMPTLHAPEWRVCDKCGVRVKARRLARHLRKVHQTTASEHAQGRLIPRGVVTPSTRSPLLSESHDRSATSAAAPLGSKRRGWTRECRQCCKEVPFIQERCPHCSYRFGMKVSSSVTQDIAPEFPPKVECPVAPRIQTVIPGESHDSAETSASAPSRSKRHGWTRKCRHCCKDVLFVKERCPRCGYRPEKNVGKSMTKDMACGLTNTVEDERSERLEFERAMRPAEKPPCSIRTLSGGRIESNRRRH
jgi:hypothetical protein